MNNVVRKLKLYSALDRTSKRVLPIRTARNCIAPLHYYYNMIRVPYVSGAMIEKLLKYTVPEQRYNDCCFVNNTLNINV